MTANARLAGGALLALTACASGAPADAPPSVEPARTPVTLAFEPASYRHTSIRRNVTEAMGQPTSLDSRLEYTATLTVVDRVVVLTIDSIPAASGQLYMGGDLRAVEGVTIRIGLSDAGRPVDFEVDPPSRAPDPIVGQITAGYRQYFPRVPASGVTPGSVWTDTTSFSRDQDGAEIVLEAVTDFRAGQWNDTTQSAELAIEWIRRYTIAGSGEQMGQSFTISGEGSSVGSHRFRASGRYLGGHVRDSSESLINVTSLGLTVPLTQTGLDSIVITP